MTDSPKKKVLVVDDDSDLRTVLVDKLIISGFEVDGAENGEVGLSKTLSMHPDIILLDVMMPKMNGWELLSKLREDEWGKKANVIMLTVLEDAQNIAKAMEQGSFTYLIKTDHNLDQVVEKVREVVGK